MLVSFFGPQGKTLSLLAISPFFEASTIRLFNVIFSEQQTCHRFCLAAIQVNSRAEIDFNEMLCSFHVRVGRTARPSVPGNPQSLVID
jgi:hypothetical protein